VAVDGFYFHGEVIIKHRDTTSMRIVSGHFLGSSTRKKIESYMPTKTGCTW
jgi:hypothetical protein